MMGWARYSRFPGEPFNQCATVPLLLSVKVINGEDTLCFEPVPEVDALRGEPILKLTDVSVAEAASALEILAKDAPVDVTLRFRPGSGDPLTIRVRGWALRFDPATHALSDGERSTILHPGASVEARFLIDTSLVESFWNGGEAAYAVSSLHTDDGPALTLEGEADIEALVVYPMADIWK